MSDMYRVYTVIDKATEDDPDAEPYWHNIGTAHPFKNGGVEKGLYVNLQSMPLDGKLVISRYDAKLSGTESKTKLKPKKG